MIRTCAKSTLSIRSELPSRGNRAERFQWVAKAGMFMPEKPERVLAARVIGFAAIVMLTVRLLGRIGFRV